MTARPKEQQRRYYKSTKSNPNKWKNQLNSEKRYRNTNKGQIVQRRARLKRYNLTPEQYDELLRSQNYVCAICKKPETRKGIKYLAVDHDHKCCPTSKASCGKCVRGLLCFNCNRFLGILESLWAEQALLYMETYKRV